MLVLTYREFSLWIPFRGRVPRSKDLTLIPRNAQIREMRDEGRSMQAIADTIGLTKTRVCQILAELDDEELNNDGYRAFLRAQVEVGLAKVIEIIKEPPPKKVSAGGKVMYDVDPSDPSGRLQDFTKPLYDKQIQVDAVKALPSLIDRLSKLRGVDLRPVPRGPDEDAIREEVDYAKQLIAERAEAQRERNEAQLQVALLTAKYENPADSEVIPGPPAP